MDRTEFIKRRRESSKRWRDSHKSKCVDCGKSIKYSSKRCRKCNWGFMLKQGKLTFLKKGADNHAWRGGRTISRGYVLIYKPEHPRARGIYVFEHILIWEETHGKPLPKGWIIHHLNGIKGDNRPANLVALPDKKHRTILTANAKRIQELEGLLNRQNQLV